MECRIKTKGREIARNKIDVKAADLSAVFFVKRFSPIRNTIFTKFNFREKDNDKKHQLERFEVLFLNEYTVTYDIIKSLF